MRKTVFKTITLIFAAALLTGPGAIFTLSSQPAQAAVTDPVVYDALKLRRKNLVVKEGDLLRKKDGLERSIDELKRRNDDNQYDRLIRQMQADLDVTCQTLQKTRFDLRDVENAMI